MKLFEWQSCSFENHKKQLPEFVNYLSRVWQNRNRYEESKDEISEEEKQERKIQKQRFFDFTIDGKISARNYVGVVLYDGLRIEVYPKIFTNDEPRNEKKWQLNFLFWLTYCRKIKFPFSFADISKLEFNDFLELLICIFANYSTETISKQPYQAYEKTIEETSFLKGRLQFEAYTRNNLGTGKWQKFYCEHEPFVYDNLFNRIIKHVARRLLDISDSYLNKGKLEEVLFILHDISDVRCTSGDCDKIKLNPLYQEHWQILNLCKIFLSNHVIDIDSADSKSFCFLIPMEYIFEDFIFGFISDNFPHLSATGQTREFLALNQGLNVFQMRNDIYIKDALIIDTKYKIRATEDSLKAGVNQNDLYQMVSYAIKRNCKNALLLYPMSNSAINSPSLFTISSEMLPEPIDVHVKSIDITFDVINSANMLILERVKSLNEIFSDFGTFSNYL